MDSNIQPEKQAIRPLKGNKISQKKPRIGQGRAEIKRRRLLLIIQTIGQSAEMLKKIPEESKIEKKVINHPGFATPVQSIINSNAEIINRKHMIKDIPFYPDPTYRHPSKPVRIPTLESPENVDMSLEINTDFEENSPFQEGLPLKHTKDPITSFSKNLKN